MDQLNVLFTGLGFAALVAAFMHEREQAEGADQEHAQLLSEMRRQVEATTEAAYLTAVVERINCYNWQIQMESGTSRGDMEVARKTLLTKLTTAAEKKSTIR